MCVCVYVCVCVCVCVRESEQDFHVLYITLLGPETLLGLNVRTMPWTAPDIAKIGYFDPNSLWVDCVTDLKNYPNFLLN